MCDEEQENIRINHIFEVTTAQVRLEEVQDFFHIKLSEVRKLTGRLIWRGVRGRGEGERTEGCEGKKRNEKNEHNKNKVKKILLILGVLILSIQ